MKSIDVINSLPSMYYCADQNSNFTFVNKFATKLFGVNTEDSLLGAPYDDIRCPAGKFANVFRAQDKEVLSRRKALKLIATYQYANSKPSILLGDKVYFESHKQNHSGTINHFVRLPITDVTASFLKLATFDQERFGNKYYEGAYRILEDTNDVIFTKRQLDVLFYLLRGYSAVEIGKKLTRSYRTIEAHIDNMKYKYHCDTRQQLVEKSIENGYVNIVPNHFLVLHET